MVVLQIQGGGRGLARCDCGREKSVMANHLKTNRTTSCGCARAEMLSARRKTHGMTESREYRAWCHMKERCLNPNTEGFEFWGGRGIKVCERWMNSFESFFEDMGACPTGYTLDRRETDGHYEPGNCRWLDIQGQQNNRRNNVIVEHEGRQQTISQWSREIGISYHTLHRRVVIKGESPPHAFRAVSC
jgi:hypothetical protein